MPSGDRPRAYLDGILSQLRRVDPAELPGVVPGSAVVERAGLFYPLAFGRGIEAFRQLGLQPGPAAPGSGESPARDGSASAQELLATAEQLNEPSISAYQDRSEVLRELADPALLDKIEQAKRLLPRSARRDAEGRANAHADAEPTDDAEGPARSAWDDAIAGLPDDAEGPEGALPGSPVLDGLALQNYKGREAISRAALQQVERSSADSLFSPEGRGFALLFSTAGGGKSFFLKMALLSYAQELLLSLPDGSRREFREHYGLPRGEEILPICLNCRGIDLTLSLPELIVREYERVAGEPPAEDLDFSRLLLLVDGLDELPDRFRGHFFWMLADLHGLVGASVIVTTRPTWLPEAAELSRIRGLRSVCILPLTEEQVLSSEGTESFAAQWYRTIWPNANIYAFLHRVRSLQRRNYSFLRGLLDTPLMAMNVLSEISAGGDLPTNRSRLFLSLFERLLRWKVPYARCDRVSHDRKQVLAAIAYTISADPDVVQFGIDMDSCIRIWLDCNERFTVYDTEGPRTREEIFQAVNELTSALSLLHWTSGKDGEPLLTFSHRQYLEFFTAYAVVCGLVPEEEQERSPGELLRPHLGDTRWNEVVLYVLFLMHGDGDELSAEALISQLEKEWRPSDPSFVLLTLLQARFPLSSERKKSLFGRLLPFTGESLELLDKFAQSERDAPGYLEETAADLMRMGEEHLPLAAALRLCLSELRGRDPLDGAAALWKEGRAREAFAQLWVAAQLRCAPGEPLRRSYPLLQAHKEPLERPLLLDLQAAVLAGRAPADALSLLGVAGLISREDEAALFTAPLLDLSLAALEAREQAGQRLRPALTLFAGWPLDERTLSLPRQGPGPAVQRLRQRLERGHLGRDSASAFLAAALSGAIGLKEIPSALSRLSSLALGSTLPASMALCETQAARLQQEAEDLDLFLEKVGNAASLYLAGKGNEALGIIYRAVRMSGGIERAEVSLCSDLAFLLRVSPCPQGSRALLEHLCDRLLERGLEQRHCFSIVNWLLCQLDREGALPGDSLSLLREIGEDDRSKILAWWSQEQVPPAERAVVRYLAQALWEAPGLALSPEETQSARRALARKGLTL
ncbi:MAG: hypothetical protein IK095_08135 [Oscillospiraceae bacterium]|nr:hypothetical protein [Oscillospiraceae bacterium]